MSGFRRTGAADARDRRRADDRRKQGARTHVVADVVADLKTGKSVARCAAERGLPRDFVEQIVEHARTRGMIDVVELTAGCSIGVCEPSPDSIVCASCPLRPAAAGAARSIAARIRARMRSDA
ncbi:peptidase [Bifidobacterium anseris]|uniref:Peptidase n=1 Tax=Bifidobacterium anseris TaxID=2020963 RepID=A0A2N5J1K7_9BIFI|nr:hypothetical protein [Bifidobacterium anseris]PLS28086.1 peptidase [Bifidobacterium anseris]